MKQLLSECKGYRKELILGPLFKLSEAILELFAPLIVAKIIDVGIKNNDVKYIISHGLLLLLIGGVGFAFAFICQYFASIAGQGVGRNLRKRLFGHILSLPEANRAKYNSAVLITHLTNDVNQIATGINMFIRLAVRSPYLAIGSIIMALNINFKLGCIFLISTPLILLVLYLITHITVPYFTKQQSMQDNISRLGAENISGTRVVRAFGRAKKETLDFTQESEKLAAVSIKAGKLSALLNPITSVIINFAIIAIIYFGSINVNVGTLTTGDIIALVNYMTQTLLALTVLANILVIFTKTFASAKRVNSLLNEKSQIEYPTISEISSFDTTDVLQFNNVSFAYEGADSALENISFTLKKGETLGIIGGTGSGKSTVIRLAMRFFDVNSGEILINNTEIKRYSQQALQSVFAYVPQSTQLFSGTIRENVALGTKNASDEQIWAAIKTARAEKFVAESEKGLDTLLTQGGKNLSGGQRQRLAIARALLLNREILILDDAQSALDYATDSAFRAALAKSKGKSAIIMVSQRAAVLKNANTILVLCDGTQVGLGTHEQLLESCSIYQEICASQGIVKEAAY